MGAMFMKFTQVGTNTQIAINMALVEVIYPMSLPEKGSVLQMRGWPNGETNNWNVTETPDEIAKRHEW